MQITDFFRIIQEDIHSTVIATVDSNNLPVTCAIDIMDYDSDGLYFLTARGKNFYERLKIQPVRINQTNCLHCGNCASICSFNAIEKRG